MSVKEETPILTPSEATPLIVALDLRDPFSYLALAPAKDLGIDKNVMIDWIPIRAHTLVSPTPPGNEDDRGIRHRRARAKMIAREIAVYADAQAIQITAPYRDGPADAAYSAWLWIRRHHPKLLPKFLEALFKTYWAENLEPDDTSSVSSVLGEVPVELNDFDRWRVEQGNVALRSTAAALSGAGISQAPAYLIENEVFYGRQHLPMIRWILDGRPGEGPG